MSDRYLLFIAFLMALIVGVLLGVSTLQHDDAMLILAAIREHRP